MQFRTLVVLFVIWKYFFKVFLYVIELGFQALATVSLLIEAFAEDLDQLKGLVVF